MLVISFLYNQNSTPAVNTFYCRNAIKLLHPFFKLHFLRPYCWCATLRSKFFVLKLPGTCLKPLEILHFLPKQRIVAVADETDFPSLRDYVLCSSHTIRTFPDCNITAVSLILKPTFVTMEQICHLVRMISRFIQAPVILLIITVNITFHQCFSYFLFGLFMLRCCFSFSCNAFPIFLHRNNRSDTFFVRNSRIQFKQLVNANCVEVHTGNITSILPGQCPGPLYIS